MQGFERKVHLILIAIVTIGRNTLLEGVQKGNIVAMQRYNLVAEVDEKDLRFSLLTLRYSFIYA